MRTKKNHLITGIAGVLAAFLIAGCSSLFENYSDKTGNDSVSGTTTEVKHAASTTDDAGVSQEPEAAVNPNPGAFLTFGEDSQNTNINSGIVVIKSSQPAYNQIFYDEKVSTYEVGYKKADGFGDDEFCSDGATKKSEKSGISFSDETKKARNNASGTYLFPEDKTVSITVNTNDANATVQFSAVQTRKTHFVENSTDDEYFTDLESAEQKAVVFTQEGKTAVFTQLPYGTTAVTITIFADDKDYSHTNLVTLNRKHGLDLAHPANNGQTLTSGLVVLKESDGWKKNQISYTDKQLNYLIGKCDGVEELAQDATIPTGDTKNGTDVYLGGSDNSVYIKAVPASGTAKVTWSATQVGEPVYTYDYYKITTTSEYTVTLSTGEFKTKDPVVKIEKTTETEYSNQEKLSVTTTDGPTGTGDVQTYKSTTTTYRKTITGVSGVKDCDPRDVTQNLITPENNTDRVRIAELPAGVTIVKEIISTSDGENTYKREFTTTFTRIKFDKPEGENGGAPTPDQILAADTSSQLSKLDITIGTQDKDSGSALDIKFEPGKTIYSANVDVNVDEIILDPQTVDGEISKPTVTSKTGSSVRPDYIVPLASGLQAVTITVTENGSSSRTYTIYIYKTVGSTKLDSISLAAKQVTANGTSYCKKLLTTDTAIDEDYGNGIGKMTAKDVTGATKLIIPTKLYPADSPLEYSMTVSADTRVDITDLAFSAVPKDKHATVRFAVTTDSTIKNDSTAWTKAFTASELTEMQENASSAPLTETLFANYAKSYGLNNTGTWPVTYLWIEVTTLPYYHGTEETSKYADVSYYRVNIKKAGSGNHELSYLEGIKTSEEKDKDGKDKFTIIEDPKNDVDKIVGRTVSKTFSSGEARLYKLTTHDDLVVLKFRLLDKHDDGAQKTVTYTAVNTRTSSTETDPENFIGRADTEKVIPLGADGLYQITLGKVDKEENSTDDFPMGKTTVTIKVNGTESQKITFTKPDRDCQTFAAAPKTGSGKGIYVSSYYDTTIYLSKDVNSDTITFTNAQQDEKIAATSYKKTADANGIKLDSEQDLGTAGINTEQDSSNKTIWKTTVSNIPAGTSVVVFQIQSKDYQSGNAPSAYKECKVTFIRNDDKELRLQEFNVNGTEDTTQPFSASYFATTGNTGTTVDTDTYNVYKVNNKGNYNAPAGKYQYTAKAINADATIEAKVYGTETENVSYSETETTSLPFNTSDTATWTELTDYKCSGTGSIPATAFILGVNEPYQNYLVEFKVTQKTSEGVESDGSAHYYYVLIKKVLSEKVNLSANISQGESTAENTAYAELLQGTDNSPKESENSGVKTTAYTIPVNGTDVNKSGKIVIAPNFGDNKTQSWYAKPVVTFTGDKDISSFVTIDPDSKKVTINTGIYKDDYLGGTISVKYSVISQNKKNILEHTYNIPVSKLVTVTEIKNWTNIREDTNYISTSHEKRIGFAFGSKVTDTTNPISAKSDGNPDGNGGLDIIGSLDSGSHWGVTSFNCSGLQYFVKVGDDIYLAKFDANSKTESGGVTTNTASAYYKLTGDSTFTNTTLVKEESNPTELTIKAEVQYVGETPYLKLTHSVTGDKTVSVGAVMDTLVAPLGNETDATKDKVSVEPTSSGFTMSGSGYKFEAFLQNSLGVDDVSNFWYGEYLDYLKNVFSNETGKKDADIKDSALSFSWDNVTKDKPKVIRFTLSSAE